MATAAATVTTAHASRYLQQLCKHWSHKFNTSFDPGQGTVELPDAVLHLRADDAALRLTIEGAETDKLPRMREVVADHIRRFAFREELAFDWREG